MLKRKARGRPHSFLVRVSARGVLRPGRQMRTLGHRDFPIEYAAANMMHMQRRSRLSPGPLDRTFEPNHLTVAAVLKRCPRLSSVLKEAGLALRMLQDTD